MRDCWGYQKCITAAVYRHPALEGRTPAATEAAIAQIVEPWQGEDYSDYRRLVRPLSITGRPRWWIRLALAYHQWRDKRRPSGMFCSEVIHQSSTRWNKTKAFRELRFLVWHATPHLFTPATSLKADCNRSTALIDRNRLPRGTSVEMDTIPWVRRSPTKWARVDRIFDEKMNGAEQDIERSNAATFQLAIESNARLEHRLRDLIETARRWRTPKAAKILNDLLLALESNFRLIKSHFQGKSTEPDDYASLCENTSRTGIQGTRGTTQNDARILLSTSQFR